METGLAALIGAITGGLVALLPLWKFYHQVWLERKKVNQESDATTISEWRSIVAQLEAQINRYERQGKEYSEFISLIQDEVVDSQLEASDLYGLVARLRDQLQRMSDILREKGVDTGPIMDMPPRRPRRKFNAEFLSRTAAQDAELARGISAQIHKADSQTQIKKAEGDTK